jgi:hypothetical protein
MSQSNNPSDFIKALAEDLKRPSESRGFPVKFWATWVFWLVVMAAATYGATQAAPSLAYFPADPREFRFLFESLAWGLVTVLCSYVAFRSAYPLGASERSGRCAGALLLFMVALSLIRLHPAFSFARIVRESDPMLGGCGGFILILGALFTGGMFLHVKKAAPIRPALTGAWVSAATGSAGCFFMHLICRNESAIHLLMWHFLPLATLTFVGAMSARKVLSW